MAGRTAGDFDLRDSRTSSRVQDDDVRGPYGDTSNEDIDFNWLDKDSDAPDARGDYSKPGPSDRTRRNKGVVNGGPKRDNPSNGDPKKILVNMEYESGGEVNRWKYNMPGYRDISAGHDPYDTYDTADGTKRRAAVGYSNGAYRGNGSSADTYSDTKWRHMAGSSLMDNWQHMFARVSVLFLIL